MGEKLETLASFLYKANLESGDPRLGIITVDCLIQVLGNLDNPKPGSSDKAG